MKESYFVGKGGWVLFDFFKLFVVFDCFNDEGGVYVWILLNEMEMIKCGEFVFLVDFIDLSFDIVVEWCDIGNVLYEFCGFSCKSIFGLCGILEYVV